MPAAALAMARVAPRRPSAPPTMPALSGGRRLGRGRGDRRQGCWRQGHGSWSCPPPALSPGQQRAGVRCGRHRRSFSAAPRHLPSWLNYPVYIACLTTGHTPEQIRNIERAALARILHHPVIVEQEPTKLTPRRRAWASPRVSRCACGCKVASNRGRLASLDRSRRERRSWPTSSLQAVSRSSASAGPSTCGFENSASQRSGSAPALAARRRPRSPDRRSFAPRHRRRCGCRAAEG